MSRKRKKRITVASAKDKARRIQNWTAQKISELIGLPWGYDEPIAPREMGQSGVDIRLVGEARKLFPWSVECKWQEKWSVLAWIKQAKDNCYEGTNWLLVLRKNRHEPVIVLDAEVFFDLLSKVKQNEQDKNNKDNS